jgi:hypothetical protein
VAFEVTVLAIRYLHEVVPRARCHEYLVELLVQVEAEYALLQGEFPYRYELFHGVFHVPYP